MRLYLKAKYRERIKFDEKLRVFSLAIALGFTIFSLRLAHLQLISGGEYKQLSDKNRIRLLPLKAPRGLIYDCNGNLLADNRPSFTVSITPAESPNLPATLTKLRSFVDFDEIRVLEQARASIYAPFKQITLLRDISIEQAAQIEECSLDLPGVVITAEPCRRFPLGQYAAHALGYLGEINGGELERMADRGYDMGDYIGKAGIELVAEKPLRGEDGHMQVQVYADGYPQVEMDPTGSPRVRIDTAGRRLLTLGEYPPRMGSIVRLTLDSEIQQIAETEMGEHAGAIIVMDANTGAIRTLVSRPSFDPNVFVSFGRDAERIEILTSPIHPLINRSLQGFPPGSTFKVIMAYAGLSEGVITPETRFVCTGSLNIGRSFRCWKDHGHGSMNVVSALAYSCDVFFYNVGLRLGIDRIERYARMFGLGEPTRVGLPGEMRGLVPSRAWKAKMFKNPSEKRWYNGETVNVSVGQGYLLVTPFQLARAVATFINGGKLIAPYLIESIEGPEGFEMVHAQKTPHATLGDIKAMALVKEGMRQAVESRQPFYGTAWRARKETVPLIGKTGTAQVARFKVRAETKAQLERIPYELRDHAWFAAALDDPLNPMVIVVFCEHSGHASESAVIVAGKIAEGIVKSRQPVQAAANAEGTST
jgi:penicillin-binding protein 2